MTGQQRTPFRPGLTTLQPGNSDPRSLLLVRYAIYQVAAAIQACEVGYYKLLLKTCFRTTTTTTTTTTPSTTTTASTTTAATTTTTTTPTTTTPAG